MKSLAVGYCLTARQINPALLLHLLFHHTIFKKLTEKKKKKYKHLGGVLPDLLKRIR